MADLGTVTTILANLKLATDIAKAIRDADASMERAELRLKLADVIGALADAKIEVTEIQRLLGEKDKTIAELDSAFQGKDELLKRYDGYYRVNSDGRPVGEPYCVSCWQVRHKRFNLQYAAGDRSVKSCISCGAKYNARLATTIGPDGPNA
jgi:hypothetical protein